MLGLPGSTAPGKSWGQLGTRDSPALWATWETRVKSSTGARGSEGATSVPPAASSPESWGLGLGPREG
jgi:hypothetical protein